ncbi:MAG: hypothetical protein PHQ98_03700 [Candidatus ainarchaeum sp.]|nr:hypothetical protein [Candidatus ainarchaeum sp.]
MKIKAKEPRSIKHFNQIHGTPFYSRRGILNEIERLRSKKLTSIEKENLKDYIDLLRIANSKNKINGFIKIKKERLDRIKKENQKNIENMIKNPKLTKEQKDKLDHDLEYLKLNRLDDFKFNRKVELLTNINLDILYSIEEAILKNKDGKKEYKKEKKALSSHIRRGKENYLNPPNIKTIESITAHIKGNGEGQVFLVTMTSLASKGEFIKGVLKVLAPKAIVKPIPTIPSGLTTTYETNFTIKAQYQDLIKRKIRGYNDIIIVEDLANGDTFRRIKESIRVNGHTGKITLMETNRKDNFFQEKQFGENSNPTFDYYKSSDGQAYFPRLNDALKYRNKHGPDKLAPSVFNQDLDLRIKNMEKFKQDSIKQKKLRRLNYDLGIASARLYQKIKQQYNIHK